MMIKSERELRCMLFGMTLGRALDTNVTSLTSTDMYFGDSDTICFALCKSDDELKVLTDCAEERHDLSIEGAMRASKQEARQAWLAMFEHSETDK